ncbi:MAG: YIP1 family protein [Chloroflexi bacterium]|nr:YIP1 family protein [Chloroflexota bacterium]
MSELINLLRGALVLDDKTFRELRASPDVFRRAFTLVLVIGLTVGLVTGLIAIAQGLMSNPATEISQARAETLRSMQRFLPPGTDAAFLDNFNVGWNIAERIVREVQTPLPHPARVIFQQVGAIVSYPFGWLGSLLFYGVLVQICVILLGGRGTIAQMLGLSSLTVAPHIPRSA